MTTIAEKYRLACETPGDFRELLPWLRWLADPCAVAVEFGVRNVCSTWALLASRCPRVVSYDIVRHVEVDEALGIAAGKWEFREESSLRAEIPRCDLLFIDTLHTYGQLTGEFALHADRVDRAIAIHDTENRDCREGLLRAIHGFRERERATWGFMLHVPVSLGLTVLKRKSVPLSFWGVE